MKKLILATFLFLCSPAPVYAATNTGWICQVKITKKSSIPIRYEIRRNKLLGYEDDLTGKPNIYAIRTNTAKKLVAVRAFRQRKVVITVDKVSKQFLEVTALRKYREVSAGVCAGLRR